MRWLASLVILLALLITSIAAPGTAAAQGEPPQSSSRSATRNAPAAAPGESFKTYLPEISNTYRANCVGIPESLGALFGSSLTAYYPLWETGGSTVTDLGPYHHAGSYLGRPALNSVAALCGSAPRFDGIDDSADIFSPGFATAFNGDEGTAIVQLKIEPPAWGDGRASFYLGLRADPNNNVVFYKSGDNQLYFAYTAGGITQFAIYNNISTAQWVTYAITWSKSNDRFMGYLAGESICPEPLEPGKGLVCPPQSGLGDWSGELTSAEIGGYLGSASSYAEASIASVIILDREATPQEIRQVSAIFGAKKVLSILGDSISRVYYNLPWPVQAVLEYGGGNQLTLKSHAVSARGILFMDGMDDQTAAASSDNADVIIIALGVVDDNDGDMAALQAKAEEDIGILKESNPGATLFWLNVLPAWTDLSGQVENDKSNIRDAIEAACASTGITCWDTYTDPWITVEDTIDGVHLKPSGQAKIAAQVLQRLEASGTSIR